jgi:hypothetical protein
MSQNSRNQGFSYYICLMIEGSRSRRPKNTWIRRIRIRNTAKNKTLPSHLNNDRILLTQPGQVPGDPMDEVVAKRLQIAPPEYLYREKITEPDRNLDPCSGIWIRTWIASSVISVVDPDSIGSLDPYPDPDSQSGSRPRRAKVERLFL